MDYLGVEITGDRHAFFYIWIEGAFPGFHDGKVYVERTTSEDMSAVLVAHNSHLFIMNNDYVQFLTVNFIKNGVHHK